MSRKPTRVYVGRNTVQQVKPLLMRRHEIRLIAVDFRSLCGLKGITLSSAVWDTEHTEIELGTGTTTGNVAQTTITAEKPGPYWGTMVATFSDGTKIKRTWAVLVEQGFGVTGDVGGGGEGGEGGGDGQPPPWGTGDPPPEEYLGEVEFEYPLYEIVGTDLTVDVVVIRHAGPDGPASVDYETTDGTLVAGVDYVAKSGTLTWDASDVASRAIPMELLDDNAIGDFNVVLSNPVGVLIGDIGTTVIDAPGGGEVSFVEPYYVVTDDSPVVTVEIQRTNGTRGDASADYGTADDTAVAPDNYTETTGAASWANGESDIRPVHIPIHPLESVEEWETDHLYPWVDETNDPRNESNGHQYRVIALGTSWRDDLEDAFSDAVSFLGKTLESSLIGWSKGITEFTRQTVSPLFAVASDEAYKLQLHFNEHTSAAVTSTATLESDQTGIGSVCPVFEDLGIQPGSDRFYWTGRYSDGGVGTTHAGVFQFSIRYTGDVFDPPLLGGYDSVNNCINFPPPPGDAFPAWFAYADTLIECRRVPSPPPVPSSDLPDWPIDPDNFWWDEGTGDIFSKEPWSRVDGSYRWLGLYSLNDLQTEIDRYPLGPALPVGHASDTEEFWQAARDAAVLAGTLPSSVNTYQADGAGGENTFPRNSAHAYHRDYKLPLSFNVELSNPIGADLIEPDTATVYIIPS